MNAHRTDEIEELRALPYGTLFAPLTLTRDQWARGGEPLLRERAENAIESLCRRAREQWTMKDTMK